MGVKKIIENLISSVNHFRQLDPRGHPPDAMLVVSLTSIVIIYCTVAYRLGLRRRKKTEPAHPSPY